MNELKHLRWVHEQHLKATLTLGENYEEKEWRRKLESQRLLNRAIAINVAHRFSGTSQNICDTRGAQFDTVVDVTEYQDSDDDLATLTSVTENSDLSRVIDTPLVHAPLN